MLVKPRFQPWQLGETAHMAGVIIACVRDRARRESAERPEGLESGVGEEGSAGAEPGVSRSAPSPTQREISQHRYY